MRNFAFGVAVGVGVGAGGAYFYLSTVKRKEQQPVSISAPGLSGNDKASEFRYHPALKYGVPQTEVLRFYSGFVANYDCSTRNPKWVLEHLTAESVNGEGDRKGSEFFEDPGVEERFRGRLEHFRGSGYDRGHLAPAANHKGSQEAMNDTFTLSNMSPQVGKGFNRDYWARFEKFVKDLTKRADEVLVVTGPLYMPAKDVSGTWAMRHPLLGKPPRLMAIPTHFYKVVLADNSSGKNGEQQVAVGAFVMPNAPIDPKTPLCAFVVPLESLEDVVGGKFFPGYVNGKRRKALDEAALGWGMLGRQQMKPFDRQTLAETSVPLLLPASSKSGADAGQQEQVVKPVTVGGQGAVHVCEHVACRLPAENWYEQGKQNSGGPRRR